ncbi:MAG TPA: M43 family zinc metalloprotease, partial [Cyclobacteriaceae bacterium]|nr:M43 family zinc metalloprotease [Cyclobacteriaceae bacterium]
MHSDRFTSFKITGRPAFQPVMIILLLFINYNIVKAQDERCATVEFNRYLDSIYPQRQSEKYFEQWLSKKKSEAIEAKLFSAARKKSIYLIPVVVHIIHLGEPLGEGTNISDEQVSSQIAVLNEDYRRLNPDTLRTPDIFKPVASDAGLEFRLATRDPDGNATTGITRVQGSKTSWNWDTDDELLKSMSFWPPEDYLNIWVCNLSGNFLGYSQYPVTDLPGTQPPYNRETDGVVIDYEAFGSVVKGSFSGIRAFYDRGRTTTHEIGHFFSLRHIWGDESGCAADDYCNDTPLQADSYADCSNLDHPVSCGTEDMYQNFMDYTYDQCMNIFTIDQAQRMQIVLENSPRRASLLTSPGLLPPANVYNNIAIISARYPANISCDNNPQPVLEVRNFGTNRINSVTIQTSLDGGQGITNKVPSGIDAGEYADITLSPINIGDGLHEILFEVLFVNDSADIDAGNNRLLKVILVDTGRDRIPARTDFRTGVLAESGWSVYNPDLGMTWEVTGVPVNFRPNYSAVIRYYQYEEVSELDWLVSPVLDFSNSGIARMRFSYSYADAPGKYDFLQVKISTDCGESFPHTVFEGGGELLSLSASSGPWIPDTKDQW